MQITTDRLTLRPFRADDWQQLYEYLSDPEVVLFEPYEPFTEDMCRFEAERRTSDPDFIAVCLNDGGQLIGNMYMHKCEFDMYEIGYVFNKRFQKHGYATEAARAIIHYAFDSLNARRITALCDPANENSWRLMERLGMRREALHKKNIYFKYNPDGTPRWLDTYVYAALREDIYSAIN